ncbi:DUF2630 family protein [Streptomyces boncukensis]|uniref:DUF2630 family protein n=1 Tax=Streptomyces boncukensis TaxID=2711219 RepID=A0A6G4X6G3_9ACTN|nr:DUF2630 family protein [Streptomyces boncukensis]NGO72450.1 DUF2630 family protein [Streptomyces boncukensis]
MGRPPEEQRERRAEGEILARVTQLVADEHRLREQLAEGNVTSEEERAALAGLERELDQCWDLLRQRRAKREFGENPAEATVRPATEVEGYLS